jgi:antirestriction protein ArdC
MTTTTTTKKSKGTSVEDIYTSTTQTIVDAIEAGQAGVWRAPWKVTGGSSTMVPTNAATGNAYRGGNVVVLWLSATERGYSTGTWATFKQWQGLECQVRRGEKGTAAILWSKRTVVNEATGAEEDRFFARTFHLFNADQVDGWETPDAGPVVTPELADVEAWFDRLGATMRVGAPSYTPTSDTVAMPPLSAFDSEAQYWTTRAHELAHWTSHVDRCDRPLGARGTDAYAREELIAELSSAFTCAHLGVMSEPHPETIDYLAGWLRILKADPKALHSAAAAAQKATDFLIAAAG